MITLLLASLAASDELLDLASTSKIHMNRRKRGGPLFKVLSLGLACAFILGFVLYNKLSAAAISNSDISCLSVQEISSSQQRSLRGSKVICGHGNRAQKYLDLSESHKSSHTEIVIRGMTADDSSELLRRINSTGLYCEDGTIKVTLSKLNDEFCDCPSDGLDEPGTSACANSHFWCGKEDDSYIFSSRVNDGNAFQT